MTRISQLAVLGTALIGSASSLAAQATGALEHHDAAAVAWDRGDYPEALEHARAALDGAPTQKTVEAIASLTGERYMTHTLAPDGHNVRWSPDGTHVSYETGERSESVIHLVRVDGPTPVEVLSFEGWDANFLADGRSIAHFRRPRTEEWEAAREAEEVALEAGDDNALRNARSHLSEVEARSNEIVVRSLVGGAEALLPAPELERLDVAAAGDGSVILVGRHPEENGRFDLYLLRSGRQPRQLSSGPGMKGRTILQAGSDQVVYSIGTTHFAIHPLESGRARQFEGREPVVSADGSTLVYLASGGEATRSGANVGAELLGNGFTTQVITVDLESGTQAVLYETDLPVGGLAVSPSGSRIAFSTVPRDDWEVMVIDRTTGQAVQLTREIQHDRFPAFLSEDRLIAMKGEARHRRAYLYSLSDSAGPFQLFHNNTIRTVAPQYSWIIGPDGGQVLVVADRDGDTLSPERGVHLVDLRQPTGLDELRQRIDAQYAAETSLRQRAEEAFAGIESEVRERAEAISLSRISRDARDLFEMGSRHVSQPGNARAIEYLSARLREMGYETQLEWFETRDGIRTANVVATLPGSIRPDQINVISTHFDSVDRAPGSDDNGSGTTVLLEVARVLAGHPQEETIRFAFMTGEESGLLGSREHVRLAQERGDAIVGVLNNDMVGWTENHRLDNTIRYSNRLLRDVQHGAAILFSDLITYDSRYVLSTDAQAFWDGYGDVISGIGSYPILGNPHYHQPHDSLETVNQRLVAEVARTTVATILWMATSEIDLTQTRDQP